MMENRKIRAIVVDDEKPIVDLMRKYLEDTGLVEVDEVLSNPLEVMAAVRRVKPDVVFLDIEMPQITGLELAEEISGLPESIEIIFVTAYNQYAIEAFKVNALDYLMKPVSTSELLRVLNKVIKKHQPRDHDEYVLNNHSEIQNGKVLRVKSFGGLSFFASGSEEPIRFSTSKCSELLAYMVFHKEGTSVSKWKLMDILWPDKDDEKSAINLRSTICRVNKTLKEHSIQVAIIAHKNSYQLDVSKIEVDAVKLEKKALENVVEQVSTLSDFQALCLGELFENQDYEWARAARHYYARLFIKLGKAIIDARIVNQKEHFVTFQMLEYLLKQDPYNEELHERVLVVLNALEGKHAVIKWYDGYKTALMEDVGLGPGEKLRAIYDQVMNVI